mgnify:CR=1 FL=1
MDTSVIFSECLCGPCAWHEYDPIRYLEDAEGDLPSHHDYTFEFNQGRIIVEYVYEYPEDYHSHSWSFRADPLPRHYFELKSRWFPIHPLDDPHYMDRLMQTRLSYAAWPPV